MALDVYVGSMTRFFRREWENVVQRTFRETGMQYRTIYAGGEPDPPLAADEIRGAVVGWCQMLSDGLAPHGCEPVQWSESDSQPYFTDRPGWEGYGALLVWAAHAEHPELPLPADVPESWADDTAFQRSTDREFRSRFQTILKPQLWLPAEFPFVFEAPTLVSEDPSCIGSTFTLRRELDELHMATLEQLPPAGPDGETLNLAAAANFGLSIFRQLASNACQHRLPIMLHF